MSDRGESPYIIVERSSGGIGAFLVGALIGAGAALLLAPRSGEETQEELRARARRLREAAGERMKDAQHLLSDKLDTVREDVGERIETVREAVESGRQAARDAREDIEQRLQKSKAAYRAGIEAARETASEPLPTEPSAEA